MKNLFPALQKLGRSLMLPIAVLPVASLLLRLGQPDLLDLPYVAAAGNAVFANLGLLFAIGIAVGLADDNNGAAGLAAAVAYFVTTEGAKVLVDVPSGAVAGFEGPALDLWAAQFRDTAINKLSVPAGLISGITAGQLYNRYSDIRMPDYLAFFAGRRFVPIASGFVALVYAALFGYGAPALEAGINDLSQVVVESGEAGLFVFGFLNRILIVTGLHHVLNNLAWFLVGDFEGVTGDLRRFFAGDPDAGAFMTGFFPVIMFGLPAACLAMYRSALSARRKAVGGLLLSMALTAFLTGVTEPVEFSFMFLAPVLFVLHAVLTGLSMVVTNMLDIKLGFGFSAGLFDYIINFDRATRPLLMLPIGAAYFALYYVLFRFAIVRFDLKTPGREEDAGRGSAEPLDVDDETEALIAALGGRRNLLDIDACTTRLRLRVADNQAIDESALKSLGAAGVLRPTEETVQVVIGLRADGIASAMRNAVPQTPGSPSRVVVAPAKTAGDDSRPGSSLCAEALVQALGSAENIELLESFGTRLAVQLHDARLATETAILATGCRGIAKTGERRLQLLFADDTELLAQQARAVMGPA